MAETDTIPGTMTDLDMLFDFAKDTEIAAMSYTAAAGLAHDPKVRVTLQRLAGLALESQERTLKLMRRLGARV